MTSITVHNLDRQLAALLKARAKAKGTSLNQTIKELLEQALGVKPARPSRRKDFEKFLGTWTKAEKAAFDKATADFERVDDEAWR